MGAMKEILIDFICKLSSKSGYEFEELQEQFFGYLADCHEDGVEPNMKYFIGVTMEHDW